MSYGRRAYTFEGSFSRRRPRVLPSSSNGVLGDVAGQGGGVIHGLAEAADFIDQAEAERVGTHPHAALGHVVHFLRLQRAALGHQAHETLVDVIDIHLHAGGLLRVEGTRQGVHVAVLVGAHGDEVHTHLADGLGELRTPAEIQ